MLAPLYDGSTTLTALLSDPDVICDAVEPTYGRTVSGYGAKIPTRYRVRYLGRVRRVYVMQYGNAGSAYIIVRGAKQFIDLY
jgi:hypothetical protein